MVKERNAFIYTYVEMRNIFTIGYNKKGLILFQLIRRKWLGKFNLGR